MVASALRHFDGERYRLLAWCIMPNHVHGLVETSESWPLAAIVHSWKSYTANQLNRLARFHKGEDLRRPPYVVFRTLVNARPVAMR